MVKVLDEFKPMRDLVRMQSARSLAENLFVIDHPLRMPGGVQIGTRTTLIRTGDGKLWVHSPGPLTPGIADWLRANGPIGAFVAPNLLHHMFLRENVEAFPDVPVFGPPGLDAKTDVSARVVDVDATPWKADIDTLLVGGCPKMNELVFFHAASRTLVLTDLAFNVRSADSFVTRLFMRVNGALGTFGPSRLAKRVFLGDLAEVRIGIDRILAWDFDRVVVSHGEVLESGGREALRTGYAWLPA